MSHLLIRPLMGVEAKESAESKQCVRELDDTRVGLRRSTREQGYHWSPFFPKYKPRAYRKDSSSILIKRWERIDTDSICSTPSRKKAQQTSRVISNKPNRQETKRHRGGPDMKRSVISSVVAVCVLVS